MDHPACQEAEACALTRFEVVGVLLAIRSELLAGDVAEAANVLAVLAERLAGDDVLIRRQDAVDAGWTVSIH